MRKIFIGISVIIVTCSSAHATDYTQESVCEAAYLFAEGSGTTVDDASSNTNTGTFLSSGNPAWSADVPAAYAAGSVDFSSDYINVPDDATLDFANNMTLMAWVYPDTLSGASNQVIAKDNSGGSGRSYNLYVLNGGNIGSGVFKSGDTESNRAVNGFIGTATWYHIGVTYEYVTDGSSVLNFYKNGVNIGTYSNCVGPLQSTASAVRLGNRQYSGAEAYFDGKITEVGLFSATYTATEFSDIYDNGLGYSEAGGARRRIMIIQ